MNHLYIAASIVLVLTGIAHSLIGELMIFRKVSGGQIVPNRSAPPLKERNIRILWASWHLTTVFGFVLAFILFQTGTKNFPAIPLLSHSIATACLIGSLLVLFGTKGRHPGWLALGISACLIWFAISAT